MRLDVAAQYQSSFDAVAAGTANSVQLAEVQAVIAKVRGYFKDIVDQAGALEAVVVAIEKFSPERREAILKILDGDEPLAPARVSLKVDQTDVLVPPSED